MGTLVEDLKEVQNIDDFYKVTHEHGYYSRADMCYCFILFWDSIYNKEALYEIYKTVLTDNESREYYNQLIKSDIVDEIRRCNCADTVDNEELKNLADENGYITVYHGHCKKTLRGSYSWTTDYETAKRFGSRNALFSHSEQYYVVTGKVKLTDIITYITNRNEREVLVKPSDIKDKTKEYFSAAERVERPE